MEFDLEFSDNPIFNRLFFGQLDPMLNKKCLKAMETLHDWNFAA
jgi:hypothetical protein